MSPTFNYTRSLILLALSALIHHAEWCYVSGWLHSKLPWSQPDYQGLFVSDLMYVIAPRYAGLVLGLTLVGPALWPWMVCGWKVVEPPMHKGQVVTHQDWLEVEQRYERFKRQAHWPLGKRSRNQLFVGLDLMSEEPVFIEGEQVFQGIQIIGAQGSGKTSTVFKTLVKQLATDPKTAFLIYTLKQEDAHEFMGFLETMGRPHIPYGMANLLDLTMTNDGAYTHERLSAILRGSALATGLANDASEPFWINASINRLVQEILEIPVEDEPTLGRAFGHLQYALTTSGNEMELSLLETIRPAFHPFLDPASRVSSLFSPCTSGGLHLGYLFAKPHSRFRQLLPNGKDQWCASGPTAQLFPFGLYELPPKVRLGIDWSIMTGEHPISIVLPAPGASIAERNALNIATQSLHAWMMTDIGLAHSVLLETDPQQRNRIIELLDENHTSLSLQGPYSHREALSMLRQAGFGFIGATQNINRLKSSGGDKSTLDDLMGLIGTWIFMATSSGREQKQVLQELAKSTVFKIRTTYSENQAKDKSTGVSESIEERETAFLPIELYQKFQVGMALYKAPGKATRLIYCPWHDRVQVEAL